MTRPFRWLVWLLLALLATTSLWRHGSMQWVAWTEQAHPSGLDYASFHYAVKVAWDGGDPYDTSALVAAARQERTRSKVHPFFYPPPALVLMSWTRHHTLQSAYERWFWIDAFAGVLVVLLLAGWWRALGPPVWVGALAVLGWLTAFANNHVMGQVNLPVMGITLGGLALAARGRPGWGGALVGVACMIKMAPALFVVDALVRRQWRLVAGAVASALALSGVAVGVLGVEVTRRFYVDVLPGFASGDYNGLRVPLTLWANHSIPNLWIEAFPAEVRPWREISPEAMRATRVTLLAVVGLSLWRSARGGADQLSCALRVGMIGVLMLLIPTYTYEHHVVWAIPAVIATLAAMAHRRLSPAWLPLWLAAFWIWSVDLVWWKSMFDDVPDEAQAVKWAGREAKMAALLVFWGLSVLGLRGPAPSRAGGPP